MKPLRTLCSLLLVLALLPGTALAFDSDDLVFDDDDLVFDDDDLSFDDDDLSFDDDDLSFDDAELTFGDISLNIGVIVVPSDVLSDAQRSQLQQKLLAAVRNVPNVTATGDEELLPAMIDREPDFCAREALCLASVGRAGGVDRIVQARVERVDGRVQFNIDHFDVQDRLFVAYYTRGDLSSFNAIDEYIQPGVNQVLGIRERRRRDDGFVDVDVDVPRVMAFTSGGLAVVALGVGTFFGLRASDQQEELNRFSRDEEGRYIGLTQVDAQNRVRALESSAFNANLSLGIGSALAVTSIVLFIVSSRGSGDAQASLPTPWYVPTDIAAQIDAENLGFGARWNF